MPTASVPMRTRVLAACAVALAVVLVVVATRHVRRARHARRDRDMASRDAALTTHNLVHPRLRALRAPQRPVPSGNVWAYNVGSQGFTRHLRAISDWYTPPNQYGGANADAPLGPCSVQLYANGSLNNLSMVATDFSHTRGLTVVLNASARVAWFTAVREHGAPAAGDLAKGSTVWIHRFPITFQLRKVYDSTVSVSSTAYVPYIPAITAATYAQAMPVLKMRSNHISSLGSAGDTDMQPKSLAAPLRPYVTGAVRQAFEADAVKYWTRHLHVYTPMFCQFGYGQTQLSSLVDVYNAVEAVVTPTTRMLVGANQSGTTMSQDGLRALGAQLQSKFARAMPGHAVTVTPADLFEAAWSAKHLVSGSTGTGANGAVLLDTPGIGACHGWIKYPSGVTAKTAQRYDVAPHAVTAIGAPRSYANGMFVIESMTAPPDDVWGTFQSPGFAYTTPWRFAAAPTRRDAVLQCP